jgi:hypothetical protein
MRSSGCLLQRIFTTSPAGSSPWRPTVDGERDAVERPIREDDMFPSFCGAMGVAGWLAMLLLWVVSIAVVVWGITRLFPDRSATPTTPEPPQHGGSDDTAAPLVDTGRR